MSHSRTTARVLFAKADAAAKAGHPTKRRKMVDFEIDELSGVDHPAQKGAKICLAKRDGAQEPVFKRKRLLTEEDGHTHMIDDAEDGGYTSYERAEGEEYGHSHPWVRNDDGTIAIGLAMGHKHKAITKRDETLDNDPPPAPIMAKNGGGTAPTPTHSQETPMTTPAPADARDTQIATLQADLRKRDQVIALSPAHRAVYDGLPADERDGFLAKSSTERETVAKAREEANPVVYTSEVDGAVYRKADDSRLVEMAKRHDADRKEIAKAREEAEAATFEKRAAVELGNLPKTAKAKAALLRAVEKGVKVPDDLLPEVKEILKAANSRLIKAATEIGNNGAEEAPADDSIGEDGGTVAKAGAQADYQKGLVAFAKAQKIDVLEKAEIAYLKTEDGKAAYNRAEAAKSA